jgi:hypothetical protein
MSADKIGAQHQARKAVLYVRQSSPHQVQHNRESQILQDAMRERLVQLGWSEIEGIDEALVHSTHQRRDGPEPKLLCDDRLATDGIRTSGRQPPVQHRHANGRLSLLGRKAASA